MNKTKFLLLDFVYTDDVYTELYKYYNSSSSRKNVYTFDIVSISLRAALFTLLFYPRFVCARAQGPTILYSYM